jgi:hypothetical protein
VKARFNALDSAAAQLAFLRALAEDTALAVAA